MTQWNSQRTARPSTSNNAATNGVTTAIWTQTAGPIDGMPNRERRSFCQPTKRQIVTTAARPANPAVILEDEATDTGRHRGHLQVPPQARGTGPEAVPDGQRDPGHDPLRPPGTGQQ